MPESACEHCAHWDSRDALVGFCQEITDHFLLDKALALRGLAPCRTASTGRCVRFEPSPEALRQERAERLHLRALARDNGLYYPASLNQRTSPWPSST